MLVCKDTNLTEPLNSSIFGKSQVGSIDMKELTKGLHLLDDSEIEDAANMSTQSQTPTTPTAEVPSLRASRGTDDNCSLLTR